MADKEYLDITANDTDIEYIDSLDDDINAINEDTVENNQDILKTDSNLAQVMFLNSRLCNLYQYGKCNANAVFLNQMVTFT